MKYVKKTDDIGKAIVHLDLEGLELNLDYDITPLLNYKIETYAVLKANASEFQWNTVFGLPNAFMSTMSDSDKRDFVQVLSLMHYRILAEMGANQVLDGTKMITLESELSKTLNDLDQKISLYPKIVDFVEKHVPIQSFAGAGERAQDSVAMTYYRDDVVQLTSVALMSKLLAPIFGIFIESCKKKMDNSYKEMHCAAILKDILDNRARELLEKTTNFIRQVIKHILPQAELTQIYNGYTVNVIVQQILSNILVRRFVTVDLLKDKGNLVTYVTSCSRAAAQTQFSSTGFKTSASTIKLPEDEASKEDGNLSNLEAESKSSSCTADYALLAKAAMHQLSQRFPMQYELDTELLADMQGFHAYQHTVLTPINAYIMDIVFGDDLGGGRSIELLDGPSLNTILPILQLYLWKHGYRELVHAVTLVPTGQLKSFMTGVDTQLRATWNNSYEYRNCEQIFPYAVNNLRWDTGLKTIVESVTTEQYLYNTAPAMWEHMEEQVHNGELYITPEGLSKAICTLIEQTQQQYGG